MENRQKSNGKSDVNEKNIPKTMHIPQRNGVWSIDVTRVTVGLKLKIENTES